MGKIKEILKALKPKKKRQKRDTRFFTNIDLQREMEVLMEKPTLQHPLMIMDAIRNGLK